MSIVHYIIPSVPVKVTPLQNYASTEDWQKCNSYPFATWH